MKKIREAKIPMFDRHFAIGLFTGKPSAPERWGTTDGVAVSMPFDLADGGQAHVVCWSEFGEDGRLHCPIWKDVAGRDNRLEGVELHSGRAFWLEPVEPDEGDPWLKELKAGRKAKIVKALQEYAENEASRLAREQI